MSDSSPIRLIELKLANENPNSVEDWIPIFITGFEITYSELCGGIDPDSIIGTEIKPQESFQICVCAGKDDPPIASGVITLSTLGHMGGVVAKVEWSFSGTMSPNTLEAKDVRPLWLVHVPEIPPHGEMGHVTVTFKEGVLE